VAHDLEHESGHRGAVLIEAAMPKFRNYGAATFSQAATVPWNFVSDESAATGTLRPAPRFFPI
jgi:hypothetical protein